MNWMVLAGSLAAVFAVAGLVWFLDLGKSPIIEGEAQAMQLARDAHSGFRPVAAIVDMQGSAALVSAENGEVVLVRPHGAQMAARVFRDAPTTQYHDGKLEIQTGERIFGNVMLEITESDARRWIALLGQPADA